MTEEISYPLDQWAYQSAPPACEGRIRSQSSDFRVTEELGFELSGEGKHLWIFVEKTDKNTVDVSRGLARATGLHQKEIGFSGQKDRNAVTAQWFSILAERDADSCMEKVVLYCEREIGLTLLESHFHTVKLKTGSHKRNLFSLVIRDLSGDLTDLESSLRGIKSIGVPNYFGPQRFGRNGKNLATAERLFNGKNTRLDRQARSMALSSARSWIFNQVVSERLKHSDIQMPQLGDALMLSGTNSWFSHDGSDSNIIERWKALDLHITAPMWGEGRVTDAIIHSRF